MWSPYVPLPKVHQLLMSNVRRLTSGVLVTAMVIASLSGCTANNSSTDGTASSGTEPSSRLATADRLDAAIGQVMGDRVDPRGDRRNLGAGRHIRAIVR